MSTATIHRTRQTLTPRVHVKPIWVSVLLMLVTQSALALSIADSPLYLTNNVPPNILLSISVESPMGGAAYNDQASSGLTSSDPAYCSGRQTVDIGGSKSLGTCYSSAMEYLGYFDPKKCYLYDSSNGYFYPTGSASNYACSSQFSGNFMNWASMTAMDMFVLPMTGGNRVLDINDSSKTYNTVIQRSRKADGNSVFPYKAVGNRVTSTASGSSVSSSSVTPWNKDAILIENTAFGIIMTQANYSNNNHKFSTGTSNTYNLRVAVCVTSMPEGNCVKYGSVYKPEGLIQENASSMRFAVSAYLNDDGNDRDGGVMRALMKSVGTTLPDGTANGAAEFDANGLLTSNPDNVSGVSDSGVIKYLNRFNELADYKRRDPVSELYYESLRYLMGKAAPTAEYVSNSSSYKGSMPVFTTWDDPWQYSCQQSFIIGLNDANPWSDKRLPGTSFTSSTVSANNGTYTLMTSDWTSSSYNDYGEPSSADGFTATAPGANSAAKVDVSDLTDRVGELQGINGTSRCIGCVIGGTQCGNSVTTQTLPKLGDVMGTCPAPQKENSYYIAGLAFMANTYDLRADLAGIQSVKTYMIDSQEFQNSPLTGEMNMLWLAGKYGGFTDANDNNIPDQAAEWDADGDGEPDNYVLATDASRMVTALKKSFADIEKRTTSSSTVAANSTQLDTNTKLYQARFDSSDWSGDLISFPVNSDGSLGNALWQAKNKLPAFSSRDVFTRSNESLSGIAFNWATLTTAQKSALNKDQYGSTDSLGEKRVDYVRGDLDVYDDVTPNFRFRSNALGDIVNSNPIYVATPDFGYGQYYSGLSTTEKSAYTSFRNTDSYRSRPPMIYVGANDGMLHGFNATTGVEEFAYIPSELISRLPELTDNRYSHKFFVDGSPRQGDAYINSSWKSVLIGATAAGGRSVFALDVTTPGSFSASDVLWEYSNSDDGDLGNVLGQPTITKLDGGEWVALVGNGPNGDSDQATLFVIRLSDGALLQKVSTGVGSATNPNGLFAPVPVDADGDRDTDYIYAGDLLGNLWKFDPDDWTVKQRLFTACDTNASCTTPNGHQQPITVRPMVITHPNTSGFLVLFGTGRYFAVGDDVVAANPRIDAFYGIFDNGDGATVSRSDLVAQSILAQGTTNTGFDYRITSNNSVDYSSKKGWYLPLLPAGNTTGSGERVISDAVVRNDRIIFTTMTPQSNPCSFGGTSWLMELDVTTGGRLTYNVLDTNNDGVINNGDYVELQGVNYPVSGSGKDEIIKTPTIVGSGAKEFKYSSGSSGNVDITLEKGTGKVKGRQSWNQLQ